jgi:hypothetical protein
MNITVSASAKFQPRNPNATARRGYRFLAPVLAAVFASSIAASAEPSIHILKGVDQQTTYASDFAAPLTVWVNDSVTQQSLSGVRVNFTAGPGIGLSTASVLTNEHGLASVIATGLAPGASTASAEIDGLPATRVQFEGLIVNKAVLTVVPADIASSVGNTVPAITGYTIQGFVNGDTEATAQISGSPVLTTTAKDNSPHANYAIKGGVGTLSSPNYTFVAGFGTLAVSGAANGGESDQSQESALETAKETVTVQPALMDKPVSMSLREPAFLAGLRGESGIFVQKALSANPAVIHTASLNSQVRNAALPKAAAMATPASAAPVRAAVTAKAVAVPAFSAPVRTAVAVNVPTAAASVTSPYAGSSIRKALIVPGTK